jgi:SAM-dependent methyltransferase
MVTNTAQQALRLPPGAEFFIVLQRPAYGWPGSRRIRVGRGLYERHVMPRVERRRRDAVAQAYWEGMLEDYESLKPYLPERATSILDIGCGLAGIDLMLYRHYPEAPPAVALLDRDGVSDQVYYGYEPEAAHYASLELARRFLIENGVPSDAVTTFDSDTDGYPSDRRFDFIVSVVSWGFHYPLETYLADVDRTLSEGGILVIDVREGTNAEQKLQAIGEVETVEVSRRRQRLCVRR